MLNICAHLSHKSLTSGISDAGRVSGLTLISPSSIVRVGVFSHLQQVWLQVLTDAHERVQEDTDDKSRMMKQ